MIRTTWDGSSVPILVVPDLAADSDRSVMSSTLATI